MRYGPRVIGKAAFAKQQAAVKSKTMYGSRVNGKKGKATERASEPASSSSPSAGDGAGGAAPPVVTAPRTVALLAQELAAAPQLLVPLLVAEISRDAGPRKGALLALRAVAEEVGDAASVGDIDAALVVLQGDPSGESSDGQEPQDSAQDGDDVGATVN